jgi:hypothetical protein
VRSGVLDAGLPAPLAGQLGALPAGAALFAAMLGYDPVQHLVPAAVLGTLPPAAAAQLVDPHFYSQLLAQPFVQGMRIAFEACIAMCLVAGLASILRGADRRRAPAAVAAPEQAVGIATTPAQAGRRP